MTLVKDVILDMTFDEAFIELERADYDARTMIEKARIFSDAAYRELFVNYKECELKVMQESGTEEDLVYLYGEANKAYFESVGSAVKKAAKAVSDFARKILEMIKNVFRSKKAKDTLDAAEKAIAKDPSLKKKKVEYKPVDGPLRKIDEALGKIRTKFSKANSGSADESDIREIDDIVEGCTKQKIAVVAGVSISISALILAFNKLIKKSEAEATKCLNSEGKRKYRFNTNDSTHRVAAMAAEKAAMGEDRLQRMKLSVMADGLKSMWSTIRSAVSRGKSTNESAIDKMEVEGETMYENVDSYLDNLHRELFESGDPQPIDDPDAYLDNLEAALENANDTEESVEEEQDPEDEYAESADTDACDEYLDHLASSITEGTLSEHEDDGEFYEESEENTEGISIDDYLDSIIASM